jgi:hypothetical protein
MKKNNIFNRIFNKKEVNNAANTTVCYRLILDNFEKYYTLIENSNSLEELLRIHKELFPIYHCANLDVDPYGMFRADRVENLTIDNVYLGNIHGLWTLTIRQWNTSSDKDIVFDQYANILISNMFALKQEAIKNLPIYIKMGYGA